MAFRDLLDTYEFLSVVWHIAWVCPCGLAREEPCPERGDQIITPVGGAWSTSTGVGEPCPEAGVEEAGTSDGQRRHLSDLPACGCTPDDGYLKQLTQAEAISVSTTHLFSEMLKLWQIVP